MKKIFMLLSALTFLTGCIVTDNFPLSMEEPGSGPILSLETDSGKNIQGIQGSYCQNDLCVDERVTYEDITEEEFWPLSQEDAKALTLITDKPVSSYTLGLLSKEGIQFKCIIPSEQTDKTHINLDLCGANGFVFLAASVQYTEGGDASYTFPLSIAEESEED